MASGGDTVVLVKGQSQYDTMRELTADIAVAFRRRGLAVVEIDGLDPASRERAALAAAGGRVAFFYGMNGWGLGTTLDLKRWCDGIGIPFVAHLFDHPMTYAKRLLAAPANVVWCLHDETYCDFIEKDLALVGSRAIVPVGGPADDGAPPPPIDGREIAILFPGSGFSSTGKEPPWSAAKPEERKVMDACYDLALYDKTRPLHDIIRQVLRLYGAAPLDWRADWLATVFTMLDNQLRVARRVEVVSALSALPIHVYGQGWDAGRNSKGAARFHAPLGFRETQALMAKSTIVLNVLPCVPAAPHDRMFYSMMAGAVCLTDGNRWVDRHYRAGDEIAVYDLPPRGLAEDVAELLADRDALRAMSEAGRRKTAAEHTWVARVDAILAAVANHRLAFAA
jgi:hypothetical protein